MSSSPANGRDPPPDFSLETTMAISQMAQRPVDPLERQEEETLREMVASWRCGQKTPAEEWLARNPEIGGDPQRAARLIYEEICLRQAQGETVESGEIYRRFPQWRSELEVLIDCHRLLQSEHVPGVFPQAGEVFGEFQLLAELGRGAVGRVFLATQPALSDRPLVVKLTQRSGDEHLSLARLQHTHIVPLYLVQDYPAEDLRALCMPYLGGVSWALVLQSLKGRPVSQRAGKQLSELLATARASAPLPMNFAGPALNFLSRASYVQAVCWIGASLADALHYAHQRGLVHLDIKPSNVLLAGDGQAMLLDFHLARAIIVAGAEDVDRLGGTRGYMAPEQEAAATDLRAGNPVSVALDGRADIYSLGVMLYESLVGRLPPPNETVSRRDLRRTNPHVGRSVEDLVHKCLSRNPADRYHDAGLLAADLRRHLADLPLRGVPNRSLRERWLKWRRRQPHALLVVSLALAAIAITVMLGMMVSGDRLRVARAALAHGQTQLEHQAYSPAIEELQAGYDAVCWLPGQSDLKRSLEARLELAKRARLADALSTLVEKLRFIDSLDAVPTANLRELDAGCRTVWQARTQIMQLDVADGGSQIRRQLRSDLLDLALLWADMKIRLAPPEMRQQAYRDAARLLDEAQTSCGTSPVLELARHKYRAATDSSHTMAASDATTKPHTMWEHCAVGRWLLRAGKLDEARKEFQQAIDLEPGAFWPNFYQMLCTYRKRDYATALNMACACVALSPKSAECFYNRALAYQALGRSDPALADFARALELQPRLAIASLRRAMLLCGRQRYAEASTDLQNALASTDPAFQRSIHRALDQIARHEQSKALATLEQMLEPVDLDIPGPKK
jgi:serine/threonine protein kinase/Flp pilus assembly protein TadD